MLFECVYRIVFFHFYSVFFLHFFRGANVVNNTGATVDEKKKDAEGEAEAQERKNADKVTELARKLGYIKVKSVMSRWALSDQRYF